MAGAYQTFLRQKTDFSSLGLIRDSGEPSLSCTPLGAKIIGWAQPGGRHYCFVRGYGETVFCADPEAAAPVYPVARDFLSFLRLLLSCGSTEAIARALEESEEAYTEYLWSQLPTDEQQQALDRLQSIFNLEPMEQPYSYLHTLQQGLDCSRLKYAGDPDQAGSNFGLAGWKVYFDSGFGAHSGSDKSGHELDVGREFDWKGDYYYIPAFYVCSKGVVIDICTRVEPSSLAAWEQHRAEAVLPDAAREIELAAEDPFTPRAEFDVYANGKRLLRNGSDEVRWDPRHPDRSKVDIFTHYRLDLSFGWRVTRYRFGWVTKHRPNLNTLSLTFRELPPFRPGPMFCADPLRDRYELVSPITGASYQLRVEVCRERVSSGGLPGQPCRYTELIYSLDPDLDPRHFYLVCAEPNDHPFPESQWPALEGSEHNAHLHSVCSSLHEEAIPDMRWLSVFRKQDPDETILELM